MKVDNAMTKYALFSYTTGNIGDEIQSVAASRFCRRLITSLIVII